jgi:hypothetical protein
MLKMASPGLVMGIRRSHKFLICPRMKHVLFISGCWMQLTGLLYVSDNREIHVLDGNRDNIAFCLAVSMKITVMLDVTPI